MEDTSMYELQFAVQKEIFRLKDMSNDVVCRERARVEYLTYLAALLKVTERYL